MKEEQSTDSNAVPDAVPPLVVQKPHVPIAIRCLLVLALIYTLYFTAGLMVPIALAILLNITFSPLVASMAKWRIPNAVGAAIVILTLVAVATSALFAFAEPAEEWLSQAPTSIRELQSELFRNKGRFEDIKELAQEVEELTSVDPDENTPQVIVQGPGVLENFMGDLPAIFGGMGLTMLLAFFLLASGDDFLRRMTRLGRTWPERKRIVTIVRLIQRDLSLYLVTVSIINLLLGATVALALHLLGVHNPMLWGGMVAVFNFAPYVGAIASLGVLVVVGLGEFDTLSQALTVPAVFLVLTVVEGQLLSPAIVGKRMSLSPAIVFISVMFWGWLWGVPGALMAVPIMTSLKAVFTNIPALTPMGLLFFGGDLKVVPIDPKAIDDDLSSAT